MSVIGVFWGAAVARDPKGHAANMAELMQMYADGKIKPHVSKTYPLEKAGEAIQALGGAGYTKDWPVERYLRDAKLYDIGAGTNEIRRFLIGRELIGAA